MKRFSQIGLISLLLAGALGGVGCKHNPKNITALPGSEPPKGGTEFTTTQPFQPTTGVQPTGVDRSSKPITPSNTFRPVENPNGIDRTVDPLAGAGAGATAPVNTDTNRPQPEGDIRAHTTENREMFAGNTVHFDFDKSAVKKGAETTKVIAVAEYMKLHTEAKLEIEGHCDERGTEGYNLALGERRALSVREILLNSGVSADKVTTVSFGEARPVDPGHDESAWMKNRRAEFILLMPDAGTVR